MVGYDRGPFSVNASGQFSDDERKSGWEADVAYTKGDMCAQLKVQGLVGIGASYTQPITPKYSIGCEMFYITVNNQSRLKWIGKRENKEKGSTTVVGYSKGLGPDQLNINYTKSVMKNLDFSTGLEVSYSNKDKWSSVYKFGYAYKTDTSNVKGLLDSTLKAMCIVEQPINQDSMMLSFSAKADFPKNQFDIGLGFTLNA